jgi:fatty acid desaturase
MNMQYHLEHHIYPAIPFHGLPKLHAKVKDQLPEAYHGMFAVYKEMIPALLKMRKDPGCYIHRQYPETVAV